MKKYAVEFWGGFVEFILIKLIIHINKINVDLYAFYVSVSVLKDVPLDRGIYKFVAE